MPYTLKGRNVLVTGGSRGLGELLCLRFAEEGCNVAVNYVSSEERAKELVTKIAKFGVHGVTIQADMGLESDCVRAVEDTVKALGGLDIIISNAGFTRFSNFADLSAPTAADWDTCFAVNVKAQVYLMRTAAPTFKANPDGGVFIITSSIAGMAPGGSSLPYSVSKAAQLHLMKCLAVSQAPKVRVNAVSPGLLLTEWGLKYPAEAVAAMVERSRLKKVTDLDDTAEAFIDLARNTSMTGQNIVVDSGLFSGMSS